MNREIGRVACRRMNLSPLRRPTALIPVVMSAIAFAVVIGHIVLRGTTRQADEGSAAHLWQLLMAAQVPMIAYFAVRWVPRAPRQGDDDIGASGRRGSRGRRTGIPTQILSRHVPVTQTSRSVSLTVWRSDSWPRRCW